MIDTKIILNVLREVEWNSASDYSIGVKTCPYCRRRGNVPKTSDWYQGHSDNCELSKLKEELEKLMGIIQHHIVVATTWNMDSFDSAMEWIDAVEEPYKYLFSADESIMNGYFTIILFPSGSKVEWETFQDHLEVASRFEEKLKEISHFEVVHVSFGELGDTIRRII